MRNRQHYLFIIIVLMAVGLPTRMDILPLPQPVLKYGGGFLWAMMLYFSVGLIWTTGTTRHLWLLVLVIACGTEFSQLYRTAWLDTFRATIWGKLTIGGGFLWGDVISYIAGISAAALLEQRYLLTAPPPHASQPEKPMN